MKINKPVCFPLPEKFTVADVRPHLSDDGETMTLVNARFGADIRVKSTMILSGRKVKAAHVQYSRPGVNAQAWVFWTRKAGAGVWTPAQWKAMSEESRAKIREYATKRAKNARLPKAKKAA
jgi:hypothetical protein